MMTNTNYIKQLLILPCLAQALLAKPYGNYGFYSPYPPPPNQILYEFSPLEENRHGSNAKSRETRDLTWRDEFDEFLGDGSKEPSCEQLREMWRLAKKWQLRSEKQSGVPQELTPFLSSSSSTSKSQLSLEVPSLTSHHVNSEPHADRRRTSTPVLSHFKSSSQNNNRNIMSDTPSWSGVDETEADEDEFEASKNVRDPSKEIYGLLRERETSSNLFNNNNQQPVFGTVHTHHQPSSVESSNYMDLVKDKLYGSDHRKGDSKEDGYGFIRYHEPVISSSSSSSSMPSMSVVTPFDKIKAMLKEQQLQDNDASQPRKDSFDLIKERLMNTRLSSSRSSRPDNVKSFRSGKDSSQQRRHIREIAREQQQQQIWQGLNEVAARRRALRMVMEQRKGKKARRLRSERKKANREIRRKMKLLEKARKRRRAKKQREFLKKLRRNNKYSRKHRKTSTE